MNKLFTLQLIFFATLLFLWNLFFPIFEGADEIGHFCSADYIAHKNKIPNLLIDDGCFIWHPPLYYALLSPVIKIFNLPQFDAGTVELNPKADMLRRGEYAQFVHTKDELTFKWDVLTLQIHTLRLFTSILAVLMFILTWKISTRLFPKSLIPNLSLLLFFNPMFLHIFTTLTNVTLVSLLSTAVIAIGLKFASNKMSNKTVLLLGLLIGLGFITKISAISIMPAWLIIMLIGYFKKKYLFSELVLKVATFFVGFLISSSWYIVRNIQLYGEIIEANVISKLYGPSHHFLLLDQVGPVNYINSIVLSLFKTFWSSYGMLTIRFPEIVNVFLITLTLLIGFTIFAKRRSLNSGLKIATIYALSVSIGLFVMNFRLSAMHAKDLFPGYMPFALLFGYGLYHSKNFVNWFNLKSFNTVSLILGTYLFAQVEIVKFLKSISVLEISTSVPLILMVIIKSLLVFVSIKIVLGFIKRTEFDQRSITIITCALAVVDSAVLFISTYLLYKNFI